MEMLRNLFSRAPLAALASALLAATSLLAGCASPGEPTTRRPPIPTPIGDLAAKQQGNEVILTFKIPNESIDRHRLKQTPVVEVFRNVSPARAFSTAQEAALATSKPVLVATLPSATVDQLMQNRQVEVVEPLSAQDFAGQTAIDAVYMIRTYESEKKPSSDSNAVPLTLHPSYPAIADAKAQNAPDGVSITWTAPQQTVTGTTPPLAGYRIYRAAVSSGSAPSTTASSEAPTPAKPNQPLQRVGDSASSPFLDSQVALGTHYIYSVRSVATYDTGQLESSDSNLTEVTAKDTFPPSVPQGLIVTLVPAQPATANIAVSPAYLDLSWEISPEHDVAGYNVYRGDRTDAQGTRQNADLLPTPAFRDMNTVPGHVYYYKVTAVDRAGNESAPSAPVAGSTTADTPPAPQNP